MLTESNADETLLYNNNKLSNTRSLFFILSLLQVTRFTYHFQTLIDHAFSNYISNKAVFGNLTSKRSYKASNLNHSKPGPPTFSIQPIFLILSLKKKNPIKISYTFPKKTTS